MDIRLQLNRGIIAADALIRALRKKNTGSSTKTVLIVFQQIFGDAVIIQPSLIRYTKIFPSSKGYKIKMLVRPDVLDFMRENLPLPDEIIYEAVDFKKFLEDYKYYRKIVNKYKDSADILIVPGTSLSAEIFSSASNAIRKIGLVKDVNVKKPIIMAIFTRIAYTEKVRPSKTDMMLQMQRKLLQYLGDEEYRAHLPELLPKNKIIEDKHYCVICPGSSMKSKCWPTERFSSVINYIYEKYGIRTYLCGGADEKEYGLEIQKKVVVSESVESFIGESSFSEWSAMIQHADLIIGNDSATIHMAVAANVPAICIVGVYAKNLAFPYRVDVLKEEKYLPVPVYEDMECERCFITGYYIGANNHECMKRIKEGKCSLCVEAIQVDSVLTEIDKALKNSIK